MRRRDLITAIAASAVAWPRAARAQQAAKVPVIGLLSPFSRSDTTAWHRAFRQGLRDLGWVEGKSISIEYRYADGSSERLPTLIADFVQRKVDVIVTAVTNDTLAAKAATREIPIVMAAAGDPVATGIAESLAHPGGNITGLSQMNPDLMGKRLELIKEIVPHLSPTAVLWNPDDPISRLTRHEMELPARRLGIELHSFEVRDTAELERALAQAANRGARAIAMMPNPVFVTNLKPIAEFATQHRLPSMFHLREFADAGGLLSYGVDRSDLFRRAASYVDKILKGANAADLPIEQPTKFELVINLKTAKALGLTVPAMLLATADEIIE